MTCAPPKSPFELWLAWLATSWRIALKSMPPWYAETPPPLATHVDDAEHVWVFGYGSLLWNPEFAHDHTSLARLEGYHRDLCVYSWHHRGTPATPGLVLGLDEGGACNGLAFRISKAREADVLALLDERELVSDVYRRLRVPVELADGETVRAWTYVVKHDHPQYAGRLGDDDVLRLVRQGVGDRGPNPDYVLNTVDHLLGLGLRDDRLERIAASLRAPA
ncbi:MAG: gamma-glutamylcyclotransferase [Geminicoccaceae bacterium]